MWLPVPKALSWHTDFCFLSVPKPWLLFLRFPFPCLFSLSGGNPDVGRSHNRTAEKLGLNPHSDLQSRMPIPANHCPDNSCNTCRFLENIADSLDAKVLKQQPSASVNILQQSAEKETIDIKDIISGKQTLKFMSCSSVKRLQSEDEELMRVDFYLRSGNRALAKDNVLM